MLRSNYQEPFRHWGHSHLVLRAFESVVCVSELCVSGLYAGVSCVSESYVSVLCASELYVCCV